MLKKSNLYIEKIYRDHPVACWPLDDDISFVQLFSAGEQDIGEWNTTNVSSIEYPVNDEVDVIFTIASASANFTASIESPWSLNSLSDFDSNKTSAFFSLYVDHISYLVYKYEIGISVDSVEEFSSFELGHEYGYTQIGHTFEIPQTSEEIFFFIKMYVYGNGPNQVRIGKVSLGQWSEPYADSTGYVPETLPIIYDSIVNSASAYTSISLDAYSITPQYNGIYLIKDKQSFCSPAGLPMAYGSYQSINVYEAPDNNPSIIVPGAGFLNEAGKNNTYTLEFWLRCQNNSSDAIKIIGPTNSTDGVYLQDGFISLKIGIYSKSYFVGKWYRPMLIHVKYSPKQFSLMVNGEPVIAIDIEQEYISFPSEDYDYIGIYGNDFISPLEIDSFSLYPYLLTPQMAKIHFVYGQGVQEYDFSNNKFLKKTIEIDYPVAEYAYNVIYPDTIKWRSGFSVGLDTSSTWVKPKTYSLPQILARKDGVQVDEKIWLVQNLQQNETYPESTSYIQVNPMNYFDQSSLYFKDLNIIEERLYAILGICESPSSAVANQTLISLNNKKTSEIIKVVLDENTLNYFYYDPQANETILETFSVSNSTTFLFGFNIPQMSSESYDIIGNFFASQDNISISMGGTGTEDMFEGKIFTLHMLNKYFFDNDISTQLPDQIFDANASASSYISYIGNYSLTSNTSNDASYLDIGSCGYWEDVIPLSMFRKKISTEGGDIYDIDFIQFNIDNPYQHIINAQSNIKSYITIQSASVAGNKNYSDFTNITSINSNNVIDINMATISNTKYEIFDNCIIMIPSSMDFMQYFIGIHIELEAKESISKPLIVKRCELSSFVANDGTPTKVGTKYSEPIYPFAEII